MAITTMKLFLAFIFLLVISSCNTSKCFVRDQVRFSDSVVIEETQQSYYLYTRIIGWQEKTAFIELYDNKPKFDECNKSNIRPVYSIDIDDYSVKQYVKSIIFQPKQAEKLKVIYTKNELESMNINALKFTR